jgi:signal transduction histidine kinase
VKIKTQFYLLVIGIILLPFLTFTGQILFSRIFDNSISVDVPEYEEIAPLLDSGMGDREWRRISPFLSRSRPGTALTVFRRDFMVLFSTMDEFTPGKFASPDDVFPLVMEEGSGQYSYSLEIPPMDEKYKIYLLQRFDNNALRPYDPRVPGVRILLSTIGLMLLFILSMLFFITRSITKSVMALEKATRRIAEGELDMNIDIKGSNEITSLTSSLNHMRLALIKCYAEAIEDGMASDPSTLHHSVNIITAKTDQLEGMINDLIDFVRIDSREWQLSKLPVNMNSFLASFAGRIKDDAELLHKTIDIRIDIPIDCTVPVDERLMVRALENLVNNAIRYTGKGGIITFSAEQRENGIAIEVKDNGPGIKPDDLPYIFEMFYRGTNSRREQGSGMGLSVVKGIIDSHGWKIEAASKVGSGACFTIIIPVQ